MGRNQGNRKLNNMVTLIFFLFFTSNVYAATKTLTAQGQQKLNTWSNKIIRIYATAKTILSPQVFESSTKQICAYGYDAAGFTTLNCSNIQYDSNNRKKIPSGGTIIECGEYQWWEPRYEGITIPHTYHCKDHIGNYQDYPQKIDISISERSWAWYIKFGGRYAECMWGSYRWGAPYGYQVYPGPVHIRESCLIGVKKLYFKTAPGYSYCREQAGGAEDSLELWTEAYDRAPDYVCLPNTQILSQTSFGCDLVNVLNEIKAVLNQYKSHLDNRVSTSTFYTNEDLTELNQVLSELNGGILLQTGDVQGDTNPPPMSNPWTQPMPCGYNLQIIEGTNNQEGLINQKLQKALKAKVTDESGNPKQGIDVTFSINSFPEHATNYFVLPKISETNHEGIAASELTLGDLPGDYKIKANCQGCKNEVTFTAKALTKEQGRELLSDICELHGVVNQKLLPFRVRIYNTITKEYEKDISVTYTLISFTDKNGITHSIPPYAPPNGTNISPATKTTDSKGFSSTYLTLGEKEGIYTVKSVCNTCLARKDVICRGYAHVKQIIAETEETESANPNDRDPDTGEPLTPVLMITEVIAPNNNKSFTTDSAENFIRFKAGLLPPELDRSGIEWTIEDFPNDFMDSGNLVPTRTGPETETYVKLPQVPAAPKGRPLPLNYRARAQAVVNGKTISSRYWPLKQDEIDKCRQEYMDFSRILTEIPGAHDKIIRSTFTIGIDGKFVKYIDCFSHIYPPRAKEIKDLCNNPQITFSIAVGSGYRSPRKNWLQKPQGVWNSKHQFGEAVDIVPAPATPANYKILWEKTACPKVLETGAAKVMAFCEDGQTHEDVSYKVDYSTSNIYNLANCLHLGD